MAEVQVCPWCNNPITIQDGTNPGAKLQCPVCNRTVQLEDTPESDAVATPAVEQVVEGPKELKLNEVVEGKLYKTMSGILFRAGKVQGNAVPIDILAAPVQITLLATSEISVEEVEVRALGLPLQ